MLAGLGSFATTFSDIASYFTVPTLGGLYNSSSNIVTAVLNKVMDIFSIGMPIFPDKYEESGGNEIGTQVLVSGMESSFAGVDTVGALSKVMDNVVTQPRTWKIHGYMGINVEHSEGMSYLAGLGAASSYINGFVTQFGREELNLAIKKYLRYVTESRKPFKFTTAEGDTVPAIIQSYSFKDEADNLNWVDVDIQIQEFRVIGISDLGEQVVIGGSTGSGTDAFSAIRQLGKAGLKTVGLKISKLVF